MVYLYCWLICFEPTNKNQWWGIATEMQRLGHRELHILSLVTGLCIGGLGDLIVLVSTVHTLSTDCEDCE